MWDNGFIAAYENGTMLYSYLNWDRFNDSSLPEGVYNNDTTDEIWIRFDDISANPNEISLIISGKYNETVYIGNNTGASIEFSNFTVQYGKRQIRIENNWGGYELQN